MNSTDRPWISLLAGVACTATVIGCASATNLDRHDAKEMPVTRAEPTGHHASINGLRQYYELHGEAGGTPLVLLHGGMRSALLLRDLAGELAIGRQVIAIDLQGHGRTADIDRPLRFELMADDVAALIAYLGHARADVMGYSLGGGVALRAAIQHPERVRRLVVVATAFSKRAWYPEVAAALGQISGAIAVHLKASREYQTYIETAPRPDDFPRLLDKMGEMLARDYDWSAEVATITAPTLAVYGDHDAVPPAQMARMFELLGGGQRDAGFDGSGISKARLAILPGFTHYDVLDAPALPGTVRLFLDAR